MSPIRKDDDYRATEITSWDEYVEEEIVGMQARGELDNLPNQGKPITIWKTDVNPEYDFAFSRLKNAGIVPLWMELDQEIGTRTEELWARLDAVEHRLRGLIMELRRSGTAKPAPPQSRWQRLVSWFRQDYSNNTPPLPTMNEIIRIRDRERERFLEMAAELDKKIVNYHHSLPKGGEHLQRLRWLPYRATKIFDDRITLAGWWEEQAHDEG